MPAAIPIIGAIGSVAGGAAQIAQASNKQLPTPSPSNVSMPSADAFQLPTTQQLSAPSLPQVATDYGRQPIPQTGADYDRNLMTILNSITKQAN